MDALLAWFVALHFVPQAALIIGVIWLLTVFGPALFGLVVTVIIAGGAMLLTFIVWIFAGIWDYVSKKRRNGKRGN